MPHAYVVGQMTVKNPDKWAEYCSKVPGTLLPWGGALVFRGHQVKALSGNCPYADIVMIRFSPLSDANAWHASAACQAMIPIRQEAADMVPLTYEA